MLAAAPVALCVLAACSDTLPKGSKIEKTRALGARIEVAGDPTVAWPHPGEHVRVTWLVVEPAAPKPLSWAFAACAALPVRRGAPQCAGGAAVPVVGRARPPVLELDVPDEATLGGANSLLVAGAICADGEPTFDPTTLSASCRGADAETMLVTLTIPIAAADRERNHNPSLDDDELRLADAAWVAPADPAALPLEGCAEGVVDPTVPRIAASAGTQELTLRLRGDDRETYTATLGDPPRTEVVREAIQVSHFTTGGELARQFSIVESTDTRDPPEVTLDWDPPAASDVSARGTLVRFFFVARDLRAGTAFTTRAVCVTP